MNDGLYIESSRAVTENAVQSLLRVCGLSSADMTRALLLRAKTRLAAGYRTSAQQGIQQHHLLMMILMLLFCST